MSWASSGEEVIELPPVEPLPSVVASFREDTEQILRGRFGFRPEASVIWRVPPQGAAGARLGGTFMHRWWTVPPTGRVRWSGETSVSGAGVVGGVRGWEVSLDTSAGPWLGPLRIGLGPSLRSDRTHVPQTGELLAAALLVGGRLSMQVDAGVVLAWIQTAPVWAVAGARDDWRPGMTELEIGGGLVGRATVARFIKLQIGVRARVRLTAIGEIVELGPTLHLALGVAQ
jgi:hypothetical protein